MPDEMEIRLRPGEVVKVADNLFHVGGRSGRSHTVQIGDMDRGVENFCSCLGFRYQHAVSLTPCWHIERAVEWLIGETLAKKEET